MSFLSDGDSFSSDLCSEDRNASQQRRELVEGQSSRTGALSTHVEQRAYNLRPRKDDSVTIERRSELARLRREQQNQRRNKRKEAETLRQQEIRDYEEFTRSKLWWFDEELPEKSDKDLEDRIEVTIGGTGAKVGMREWRPYFEASDPGLFNITLKGANWEVERLALQAGASVVGLQSSTGDTYLFSCSGTIVEFFEESTMIVTVANLVRCPDAVQVANNLKISVYLLQDHKTLEGHLAYHDFYHNICVIRVQSPFHLPGKRFSSNIEAINFDKICSRDVVALGRDKENHALLVTTGKIIPKSSKFDCDELLVSTCRISKVEVGGPLMDFDGNFIGMNYYDAKETPFVPSFIVLKCLKQFKLFRTVIRPWLGLRVRTLHAEGSIAHEKMQTNFHGATGVVIEKIEEDSPAKESGLNEGDIINQIDGVYISNAAELGGILLDMSTAYLMDMRYHLSFALAEYNRTEMCIQFGLRGCKHVRTIASMQITSTSGGLNNWPFPKPIIVKTYARGKLSREEWYALESSSRESSPAST
ncbi:hypothetical protein SEVIR_7G310800v4 [Setaria viridis]|uniref:PDZ domain-containing protein n=1 Tax=Setaria viridis TaxID=4556 RepID=A0A4U6U2G2_SETVI|nr:uncharacterized protein LOC117865718 [Setaria viridis]TKW07489.1 hypothetical protein SEVIR_7G310800v2 [Setaria viridis]